MNDRNEIYGKLSRRAVLAGLPLFVAGCAGGYGTITDNGFPVKGVAGGMGGGPDNPLGPRALYLYRDGVDTHFRLHGTTEPETIGQAVSSGCIRLFNQDIIDLYERVPVGAHVTVIQA